MKEEIKEINIRIIGINTLEQGKELSQRLSKLAKEMNVAIITGMQTEIPEQVRETYPGKLTCVIKGRSLI